MEYDESGVSTGNIIRCLACVFSAPSEGLLSAYVAVAHAAPLKGILMWALGVHDCCKHGPHALQEGRKRRGQSSVPEQAPAPADSRAQPEQRWPGSVCGPIPCLIWRLCCQQMWASSSARTESLGVWPRLQASALTASYAVRMLLCIVFVLPWRPPQRTLHPSPKCHMMFASSICLAIPLHDIGYAHSGVTA